MCRYIILLTLLSTVFAEHWTVLNNNTNTYCIILDSDSVSMTVKFTGQNGTETYSFTINGTQSVTGNCMTSYGNRTAQSLKASFFPAGSDTPATAAQPWDLEFIFGHDDKNAFKLLDYTLTTAPAPGMNASFTSTVFYISATFKKAQDDVDFQGHDTNAFKCSTSKLPLTNDSTIEMKNLNALAFAELSKPEFPKQQVFEQCLLDSRTSDIVPIVVGACLAGLVVIVLVAYLIGRARAKRQGYASV
ncbi:hypothetical protein OESDEN_03382 [Oesophagostomum dentatum]|uniref:Lysosome-associated membrane glycoprotein 2-like transmembrane domain-containing protein n=1 Tax=Oesophagostomum dentatum TaxID=61180 RepID=A0A0B1TLI6_OESDE|nr:hypothetical protein OESDEN_03382 [Oesophagostomum dentatum]